jgi:hypothetical protein
LTALNEPHTYGRTLKQSRYTRHEEQLAAALLQLLPAEIAIELRRRKATAKEIRALFQLDHGVLHAHDGANAAWNLWWMITPDHREKSKADTSKAAKTKRISAETEAFRAKLLAKTGHGIIREPTKKSKMSWPKGRKLQSRNTFQKSTAGR